MSKIKVNRLENTSTANGGIDIDSSGHVQIDGQQLPTAGALSNRNLIINGAMQVAQRSTSQTGVTTSSYNAVDRFLSNLNTLGTWTVSQEADAPAGFKYSLKHTCTTADSSPAGGDYAIIYHRIETQNIAPQIGYGTSSAKDLTLSFWVKSNKTGAASCGLFYTRAASPTFQSSTLTYTINSANTWEYKTVSFSPNSDANTSADNETGITVEWWMNSGSSFSGTAATGWLDNAPARNSSNIGIGGAVGDYFQITGVQLEVGSKATPFEHRSYGDELQRCQRYYYLLAEYASGAPRSICNAVAYGSSSAFGVVQFPTTMRAVPTMEVADVASGYRIFINGSFQSFNSFNTQESNFTTYNIERGSLSLTSGQAGWFRVNDEPGARLAFNAEL